MPAGSIRLEAGKRRHRRCSAQEGDGRAGDTFPSVREVDGWAYETSPACSRFRREAIHTLARGYGAVLGSPCHRILVVRCLLKRARAARSFRQHEQAPSLACCTAFRTEVNGLPILVSAKVGNAFHHLFQLAQMQKSSLARARLFSSSGLLASLTWTETNGL